MSRLYNFIARIAWWRSKKISEIMGRLTYQAYIVHLMRECSDPKDIEKELWNMGYDIGIKLYNEFFSRKYKLPEKISDMEKYGKPVWKIFLGEWPDKIIYKKDEDTLIAHVYDSFFCRDLILPEDFKFHACEIVGGIFSSALSLWLQKKNLPYTFEAHETKCRMCDDEFCEVQLIFTKK